MLDYSPDSKMRELINDEFQHEIYTQFREWFLKKKSKPELAQFKDEYYTQMNLAQDFIPFVKWFVNYFISKKQEEILVLQRPLENVRGEKMEAPFPPEQTISLSQNTEATPYLNLQLQRVEQNQVTLKELNFVIRSQNYTNAYIFCLGEQFISLKKDLLSIKNLLEKQIAHQDIIIDLINKPKDQMSTSTISDVPIVQPLVSIERFKMETNGQEFVRILEQKLKGLNITVMSHEDYSEDNNENHIDQLSDMFANLDISNLDINNINNINLVYSPRPIEKYYYKRPSPQDLLFEEPEPFQNSYSGKAIYEWNVDGLNDKQIIDTIHRMIMYSTVCKQHGNSDSSITSFITTGFVG
ncbi:unnamed protein product [Lathyrus oleraceus]